ncbi:hypothetical protein M422DRAFT_182624, partial [Sphaerobolus stellatus SS14]
IDAVLEALNQQKQEHFALLSSMADGWRSDSIKQHEDILQAVTSTANQQIPFNVQKYLDGFSKALSDEVKMLLAEVGNLREEKRNLQHELGYLMCMRSKYGPGGEFDPDWRPNVPMYGGPPGPGGPPPPGAPPAPPPAKPAWRNIQTQGPPKLSKRQRKLQREQEEAAAAAAAGPSEPAPRAHSWATWQRELTFLLEFRLWSLVLTVSFFFLQPIPRLHLRQRRLKPSLLRRRHHRVCSGRGRPREVS